MGQHIKLSSIEELSVAHGSNLASHFFKTFCHLKWKNIYSKREVIVNVVWLNIALPQKTCAKSIKLYKRMEIYRSVASH
jgi:hypothetical protein